jgi:hypothetical protein
MRDNLIKIGEALYGPRYQRDLAEALGVNERTMRRWIAGDFEPPATLLPELKALLRDRAKRIKALLSVKA